MAGGIPRPIESSPRSATSTGGRRIGTPQEGPSRSEVLRQEARATSRPAVLIGRSFENVFISVRKLRCNHAVIPNQRRNSDCVAPHGATYRHHVARCLAFIASARVRNPNCVYDVSTVKWNAIHVQPSAQRNAIRVASWRRHGVAEDGGFATCKAACVYAARRTASARADDVDGNESIGMGRDAAGARSYERFSPRLRGSGALPSVLGSCGFWRDRYDSPSMTRS